MDAVGARIRKGGKAHPPHRLARTTPRSHQTTESGAELHSQRRQAVVALLDGQLLAASPTRVLEVCARHARASPSETPPGVAAPATRGEAEDAERRGLAGRRRHHDLDGLGLPVGQPQPPGVFHLLDGDSWFRSGRTCHLDVGGGRNHRGLVESVMREETRRGRAELGTWDSNWMSLRGESSLCPRRGCTTWPRATFAGVNARPTPAGAETGR